MKKILMFAVAALMMSSCGENPADKMIKIIDDGTARLEQAQTEEEAQKIQDEVLANLSDFAQNAGIIDNIRFDEEGQNRVTEATDRFTKTAINKIMELGTAELNKIGEDAKKQVEEAVKGE